jgi:hypothetical protein
MNYVTPEYIHGNGILNFIKKIGFQGISRRNQSKVGE